MLNHRDFSEVMSVQSICRSDSSISALYKYIYIYINILLLQNYKSQQIVSLRVLDFCIWLFRTYSAY